MTTPNQPNTSGPDDSDVDARFAELISSMPELASITPPPSDDPLVDDPLVDLAIAIPNPAEAEQPLRLVVQVPASAAAALDAEFSADRVALMMQAFTAMAGLHMPPPRP